MKTPMKIVIVAALGVAVVGAVALKNRRCPTESNASPPVAAAGEPAETLAASATPPATARLPRLLDLGADKCIPCKMMMPVLEELKAEYAGKLNVQFMDVWKNPTIVGLSDSNQNFTNNLDIGFRQGSFDLGVPDFVTVDPSAGAQMGFAILSDIEAFFFINAAQADKRSNIMFAPKVTLFNGQSATVADFVQKPFVTGFTPIVGFGSIGFQPNISLVPDGVTLGVAAVVSAC